MNAEKPEQRRAARADYIAELLDRTPPLSAEEREHLIRLLAAPSLGGAA